MGKPQQHANVDEQHRQMFRTLTEARVRSEATFAHVLIVVSTGAIALLLTLVLGRKEVVVLQQMHWLKCALISFGVGIILVILYHNVGSYFFGWTADLYGAVLAEKNPEAELSKVNWWFWIRNILEWTSGVTVVAGIIFSGVFVLSNVGSAAAPSARTTMSCPECSRQVEIEVRARKLKQTPAKPPAKQP